MSTHKLPQTTDADTAAAASDSRSLAKGFKPKPKQLPASRGVGTAKRAVGETDLSEIVDAIVP